MSSIKSDILNQMIDYGMVPVMASLGYSKDGELLNINADYLATAVAEALSAEKLVLMTDVKGVLDNGQVLDYLSTSQIKEKIDSGVITGGMIPKIMSALQTVKSGVKEVLIGDNLLTGTIIKEG